MLEVEGLEVNYGRTRAVKNMSLTVAEGEVVAVLGANGAGKTSLLRALQGAVRPSGGSVLLNGKDMTALTPAARVREGMVLVPEGRQIFVSMTVHENLLMGAYLRHDHDMAHDIEAIYDRFPNLAARRDTSASSLSGGEQQMLAIGRAIVSRPRLIMLDEPSLGLSPLFVDRLFTLLEELNGVLAVVGVPLIGRKDRKRSRIGRLGLSLLFGLKFEDAIQQMQLVEKFGGQQFGAAGKLCQG